MAQSIRFGDWVWDPNTLELRNGQQMIGLEPRVARLLEYLVAHPGELLSHDRIVDAVWDGRVVSDEAVRRAVFSLRQALAAGSAENYIRTVHKKGYVAAFPPHQTLAGESTGLQSTAPTSAISSRGAVAATLPPAPSTTPPATHAPAAVEAELGSVAKTTRWSMLLKIAGALALVAAVLTHFESLWERQPAAAPAEIAATSPAAIAVLPFTNFSEDADSEFLADGLAEELLGTLARNRALRVTARSSAFQFKGQNRDIREIGRSLGVRYVLEGSVRRFEERVRINVQLIDAESGTQLWSEAYNRRLADWFAVQQDVAVAVARALNFVLQQGDEAATNMGGTTNVEAHLEVLRARQLLATRSVADAEQAIEHLQRALTLDANYALAYARLADAILIQAESTTGVKAARPVVAPLLDKALALDPGLGEAYALRSLLTDDPAVAERDLRRGLELNPSYARGYELLAGTQASSVEKIELALDSIDRAIALDPLTPSHYFAKALAFMGQGYWPEAAAMDRRALELNPNFHPALLQLSALTAVQGDFAEAIAYTRQALAADPRAVPVRDRLIGLYVAVGDTEAARAANNPPTPSGELGILWSEGNVAPIVDMLYGGQPKKLATIDPYFPIDPLLGSQIILTQALSDGDYARALALTSTVLPGGYNLPPGTGGWGLYPYANLVQLLILSGDVAAASTLQQQIEQRMADIESHFPRYALLNDQIRAVLLARAGHSDDACAALERTFSPKPRALWRIILANPAFDDMRSAPCFRALRARIDTYIAMERAKIAEAQKDGVTPGAAVTNREHGAGAAT